MGGNQEKRMIADTGYEVIHAIRVGDREILAAENMNDPDGKFYLKAEYKDLGLISQYDRMIYCTSFLSVMEEFIGSLDRQILTVRNEIEKTDYQAKVITSDQCYPHDYGQSIDGKVVVIKAEVLRHEYRRGDRQLVLVAGGFGSNANPRGNGIFCYRLYDGSYTRFERYDVLGEIKELPVWAVERLAVIKTEREVEKRPKDDIIEPKRVAGYTITERIQIGKKLFVLGENVDRHGYVTWQHIEGRPGYDVGHYFDSREKALADLQARANKERDQTAPDKARKTRSRNEAR